MNFKYEKQKIRQGYTNIVGCDEVGRGCLAGPVVAAAVVLPLQVENYSAKGGSAFGGKVHKVIKSWGIKDSKLLSPKKREELAAIIKQNCAGYGIGFVESAVIDEINIHNASLLAMKMAVERLLENVAQGIALPIEQADGLRYNSHLVKRLIICVDGKFKIPDLDYQQEAIIDGDNKILSIAAASIIAKVYRDGLMRKFDKQYPRYQFGRHKGYATAIHRSAIIKHGLAPIHRLSFCKNIEAKRLRMVNNAKKREGGKA